MDARRQAPRSRSDRLPRSGERVVKMDHDPASSGGKVPTYGHSENAVHAKRTSRPVR